MFVMTTIFDCAGLSKTMLKDRAMRVSDDQTLASVAEPQSHQPFQIGTSLPKSMPA